MTRTPTRIATGREFSWLSGPPQIAIGTAFKRWFGRSCVVDQSGPVTVFHGTDAEFDRFDFSLKLGNANEGGPFFTDSLYTAQDYGSRIVHALVSIERPYRLSYKCWLNETGPSVASLGRKGYDGFKIEEFNSGGRDGDIDGESSDISTVYVPFVSANQIMMVEG